MRTATADSSGWTLRLVRDTSALVDLRTEWDALWARTPGAGLFVRHAWFATWWRHFGAGPGRLPHHRAGAVVELPWRQARLAVLTVRNAAGRLCAVAPWLVVAGRWRRVPVRMLCGVLNAHAPRTGVLADSAAASVAGQWPLAQSALQDAGCDMVVADGHVEGSLAAPLADGATWRHLVLPLKADFDALLAARGSHFRKRERQAARALTELGAVTLGCARAPDDIDAAFARFVAVDAASWKAVSGEALSAHPRIAAYYHDLVRGHARLGACHIWVLAIGATPAAAAIVLLAGPVAHVLKLSHARACASARHAPARVLLARMIEAYCAEGIAALDFTGDMPFVERWSETGVTLRAGCVFGDTVRGRLADLAEQACARIGALRGMGAAGRTVLAGGRS